MSAGMQSQLGHASIVASKCPRWLPVRLRNGAASRPQHPSPCAPLQQYSNVSWRLAAGAMGARRHGPSPKPLSHPLGSSNMQSCRALPAAGIDLEPLIIDAAAPVLKICTLCCVGAACARKGLLDQDARRVLSKLALCVFTPALMMSKLGPLITFEQAAVLWPIGANVMLSHAVALGLGWLHIHLLKMKKELQDQVLVSSAIGNVGNLPLVMVGSLVANPHLPFAASPSEADLGVSYVMLGWFWATFMQMPLGHWLLQKQEDESGPAVESKAAASVSNRGSSVQGSTGPDPSVAGSGAAALTTSQTTTSAAAATATACHNGQLLLPVTTSATAAAYNGGFSGAGQEQEQLQQHKEPEILMLPVVSKEGHSVMAGAGDKAEALRAWVQSTALCAHPSSSSASLLLGLTMLKGQGLGSLYSVGTLDAGAAAASTGISTAAAASRDSAQGAGGSLLGPVVATVAAAVAQASNVPARSSSSSSSWATQPSSTGAILPTPTSSLSKSSIYVRPVGSSRNSSSSSSSSSSEGVPQGQLSPSLMSKLSRLPQRLYVHHGEHAGAADGAEHMHPLLQGLLSPPTLAGITAMIIGSCPPLKEALFSPSGSLSLLGDSLEMLGQPLVPVLLLVLGANLSYGPGPGHLPPSTVLAMLMSRLVVLPLLGATLISHALSAGWVQVEDPLAVVVMMLVWSTPTAILVHSLASVHENGEDEISALLFWEYLSCVLTLPVCTAGYLYMLDCCAPHVAAAAGVGGGGM